MSEPQGIPHPAPWHYWHCPCGWEDLDAGQEYEVGREGIYLAGGCPACHSGPPYLCADKIEPDWCESRIGGRMHVRHRLIDRTEGSPNG